MSKAKQKAERYVTQKAYAEMRGVSAPHICRLVREGAIVLVDRRVDVKQADRALGRAGRPARTAKKANGHPRVKAPRQRRSRQAAPASDRPTSASKSLTAARADELQYKAKIAKLDYEERIGLLVRKDEVLKAEQRKNENIRGKLRAAPREIASLYQPGMTKAEVEDLLRLELNRRLDQLARDPLGMRGVELAPPSVVVDLAAVPAIAAETLPNAPIAEAAGVSA